MLKLQVKHGAVSQEHSVLSSLSVQEFKANITTDDPDTTKLIYKGKILHNNTLLGDHFSGATTFKLMLLSTSTQTKTAIQESDLKHKQAVKNYNAALATRPRHTQVDTGYCRKVEPLDEFSDREAARQLLIRIRDDMGIKAIMRQYEWRVSLLKELHPNEKTILGFNQNKGQVIALRLRTDALDGFRAYNDIIKVMLHELAHMIHSDHDQHFHALDRELNRFWQSMKGGSVPLVGDLGRKLGGEVREGSQRDILLGAVLSRLSKEEQEIQDGCMLK